MEKRLCFVVMPFAPEFRAAYDSTIKPLFSSLSWRCIRADEVPDPRHITKDIVELMDQSCLVIADLTTRNPNVFYELAIAHSLKKPTVMITQDLKDVPFDLQEYRVLEYTTDPEGQSSLHTRLLEIARRLEAGNLKSGNPILDNLVRSPLHATATTEEVLAVEKSAQEQVWVFAPDIELGPRYFAEVMRHNMVEDGVTYRYLVSSEPEVVSNLKSLIDSLRLGEARDRFECGLVEPHLVESDVTIIDPNSPNEHCYLLAPCEAPYYHFCVTGSSLYRMKQRFKTLWTGAQSLGE